MTAREVAPLLGIGLSTCYAAMNAGDIPMLVFSGRKVVPTAALRKLLEIDPYIDED